jgi:hypothetical protein
LEEAAASVFRINAAASVFRINVKMETTHSSETLEPIYQTIWQDIPEDHYLDTSCHASFMHSFNVVYSNLWRGHPVVLIN